jgi:hypothetical protein
MGLIWKRDRGDTRSTKEVFEAVEEDIARRVFGRCTLFCGDVECREQGCIRDRKQDGGR